jgi:hypothetical protein
MSARDLAAGGEEGLKDESAVGGENAWNNFHLVIESGVSEKFETRTDGPAFGVVCAVDQARDARLDDSARAHAAWFNRDVERCARHAVVAEGARCFANYDDLCVGRRVAVSDRAVAGAGENFTVMDDAGADRDFAGGCCSAGFLEGDLHVRDVNVNDFHV